MKEKRNPHIVGAGGMSDYTAKVDNPRPLIIALGQKITDRIGVKITENDPEYHGLAAMVTDEMAEIALKMKLRVPYTLKQMTELTGKDAAYLEPILFQMG